MPVVLVAAQAPAFASSGVCPTVPPISGWPKSTTGSFNAGSGTQGWVTSYPSPTPVISNVFLSEQDNSSNGNRNSAGNNATVAIQTTLTLVPGQAYTFSFQVASRFASDSSAVSQNQYLQVQLGGIDRLKLRKGSETNTQTALTGFTALSTGTGVQVENKSFTYTHPVGDPANVVFRYLFTMPGRDGKTGCCDIAVTAPTLAC